MKEYEKLLLDAEHRKLNEKAKTMVNLGLFEEKSEVSPADIDFSKLEEITVGKLYKGVFHLYINTITEDLIYVNPLVENNEGDKDNERNMAPYAYQVLEIETVTDEEYAEVLKASQTERSGYIAVTFRAQVVVLFVTIVCAIFYLVNQISALAGSYGVGLAIYHAITDYMLSTYCLVGIQLAGLVVSSISYRKFRKGL